MNQSLDREHHIVQELLGAYLLGATEQREAALCASHLTTCSVCQESVGMLEVSSRRLAGDLPPRTPSPELKNRLMREVCAEAALFAAAKISDTEDLDTKEAPAPTVIEPSRWSRISGSFSRPLPALAGLAVTLLILLGGVQLIGSTDQGVPERPAISARGAGAIEAKMTFQGEQATLAASKLPPLESGRIYQVWLQQEGGVLRPTDVLFAERGGSATVLLPDLGASSTILITSEPQGGSTRPSRSPILRVGV